MKTTIEIELPELPEAKKGHKWEIRGQGWRSKSLCDYAFIETKVNCKWITGYGTTKGQTGLFYAELVRTHREDGTPLEIPELPKMPDNVERVEYFGTGMKPKDMGDADNYICIAKSDKEWQISTLLLKIKDKNPVGYTHYHYARVWYKKEKPKKTELADLIGEDGQKNAYLIDSKGESSSFVLAYYRTMDSWKDISFERHELQDNVRWSNSPFTKFEDANPFIF